MATDSFAMGWASLLVTWTCFVLDIVLTVVEKSCSMVMRSTDATMAGFVLYDATKAEFFATARLLHGLMLRPWWRSSTMNTRQQASAAAPSLSQRLVNAAVMIWCVATVATVTVMRIAGRVCVSVAATLLVRVPVIISLRLMLWSVAGVVALPWFAYNATAGAYRRFLDRYSQVRRMATGAWCMACDCVRLAVLLVLPVVWCWAAGCFSVYVMVQVLRGVPPSLQEASAVGDKLVPLCRLSSIDNTQAAVAPAAAVEGQSPAALEVESAPTTTSAATTISSSDDSGNGGNSSSRPMGLKLLLCCSSGGVTRRVSSTQGLTDGGETINGDGGMEGNKGVMVSSAPCTPTGTRSTLATPLKVLTSVEGGVDVLLVSAPPSPTLPAVPRRRAFGSSSSNSSSGVWSSSGASSSDAGSVGDDTSSAGSRVFADSVQYGSGYVAAAIARYEASVEQRPAASVAATAAVVVEVVSQSPVEAVVTAPKATGLAKRAFASLHAFVSVFE